MIARMGRARGHRRLLSLLAFCLLAAVAELLGAALTHRIDLGRHVRSPSYDDAAYYPGLVAVVKVGIALLLARLSWRVIWARATERTALRIVGAVTGAPPKIRVALSARLWLAFFAVTATTYLVHADATRVADGRWALLFPWLHSSALPVFAVLSVLMAFVWGMVQRWLADYEQYVQDAVARAYRLVRGATALAFPRVVLADPPRRLFGLVLDGRPPPALS